MIRPLPKSLDDPRISPYITLPSNDAGRQRAEIKKARFTRRRDFSPPSLSFPRATTKSRRSFQLYCKGVSLPEGETRERRGRDDRANASSSANYRLRSARFPVVATNFTNERSSPPRFSPVLLRFPSIGRRKEKEGGTKSVKEHSRMDRKEKK